MSNKMQTFIVACFLIFLLIVGVVLGLVWVSHHNSPISIGADDLTKDSPQIVETTQEDPEDGPSKIIIVPSDRLPTEFDQRLTAAPITLLPLQTDVLDSQTVVPARVKAQINALLSKFVPAWETFSPRVNPDLYEQKLRPFAYDQGVLGQLTTRADSIDPDGVCPEGRLGPEGCAFGSEWAAYGYPLSKSSYFIDYDGSRAYVVAFGLVRYTGVKALSDLVGETRDRAYAFILRRRGDRWYIERAVGQAFEPGFNAAEDGTPAEGEEGD